MKKAFMTILVLLFAFAISSEIQVRSQEGSTPKVFGPSDYVTTADVKAAEKAGLAAQAARGGKGSGVFDSVIKRDDEGSYIVAVAYLHRNKPEVTALTHPQVTEIYQMLTGSGDLRTGGSLVNTKPSDLTKEGAGPSLSGTQQGGTVHHIGPGESVIILPGVPHMFTKLDSPVTYLVTRIEAKNQ